MCHMLTEVKTHVTNPSVNGTMSRFLYIKTVAIIFVMLMFFMSVFVAQQLIYSQIYSIKCHASGIFFSVSSGW